MKTKIKSKKWALYYKPDKTFIVYDRKPINYSGNPNYKIIPCICEIIINLPKVGKLKK